MGNTCNSSGANSLAHSLEDKCGSNQRRRRGGRRRNSSSSSSSAAPSPGDQKQAAVRSSSSRSNKENETATTTTATTQNDDLNANQEKLQLPGRTASGKARELAGQTTAEKPTSGGPATSDSGRRGSQTSAGAFEAKLAKLKEGVDFIETEEDARAVEAATLKIQSTFRGKKFRSKLGGGGNKSPKADANPSDNNNDNGSAPNKVRPEASGAADSSGAELSKRLAEMQVNEGANNADQPQQQPQPQPQEAGSKSSSNSAMPEEEVERAATKIQAGFKGYKTRKELEGKLISPTTGAPSGGAGGNPTTKQEAPAPPEGAK